MLPKLRIVLSEGKKSPANERPAGALILLRPSFISDFPCVTGPARRAVLRDCTRLEGFYQGGIPRTYLDR